MDTLQPAHRCPAAAEFSTHLSPSTVLSTARLKALSRGAVLEKRAQEAVDYALDYDEPVFARRDTYIRGGFNISAKIEAVARHRDVKVAHIKNAATPTALVLGIVCAIHNADGAEVVVFIDRCAALNSPKSFSMLRNAVDDRYSNLTWLGFIDPPTARARRRESQELKDRRALFSQMSAAKASPFDISTKNVRFVISSDIPLSRRWERRQSLRRRVEAHIREQVRYVDFEITDEEAWGWWTHIVKKTDLACITTYQQVLDFMKDIHPKCSFEEGAPRWQWSISQGYLQDIAIA